MGTCWSYLWMVHPLHYSTGGNTSEAQYRYRVLGLHKRRICQWRTPSIMYLLIAELATLRMRCTPSLRALAAIMFFICICTLIP